MYCAVGHRRYVKLFSAASYRVDFLVGGYNGYWSRRLRGYFLLGGNIFRIQRPINDVSRSTSTAGFSTILNQLHTSRSPMRAKRDSIPSTNSTSWFAVRNGGHSIVFIDFLHAGCRKSLLTKCGLVLVSTRHSKVSQAFE